MRDEKSKRDARVKVEVQEEGAQAAARHELFCGVSSSQTTHVLESFPIPTSHKLHFTVTCQHQYVAII